jgi:DNA-directed RNA polymerase subunit RPC12/RpoP
MPFWGPSEKYPYRCNSCGREADVEDIVIDAFIASMEYKQGEMPKLECPCGGTLLYNPKRSPPKGR